MSQGNLVFYNGNVPGEFDFTAEHFQGSASHDEKKKQNIVNRLPSNVHRLSSNFIRLPSIVCYLVHADFTGNG